MSQNPFEKFIEHLIGHAEPDYSKWQQVAKFGPDQTLKHRLYKADTERRNGQAEVLISKLKALSAEQDAAHAEFWEYLYNTLQVPRGAGYHIAEDGRLLKAPKEGKNG